MLVIGAGAAGIRAALAASEAGVEVVMVAKGEVTRSGSTFSPISRGWGIQALVGKERTEKNLEAFYDDIMRVGLSVCDPRLVRILVEESGPRLEDMVSYGIRFKKGRDGSYVRAKGCFSDVERAFLTEEYENIQESFLSLFRRSVAKIIQGRALSLITADGTCWGAWAVVKNDKTVKINAKATILATGGGAAIFRDHLVSDADVGDGYALAHKAGAELNNLEFVQFMLGLKKDDTRLFMPLADLDSPGMLLNEDGEDLLQLYIPEPKERAKAAGDRQKHFPFSCRDSSCQVDIAVAQARKKGQKILWGGNGQADDKSRHEVVHFAHAFNGGVRINEMAESTISGLFAAGEVAAGSHGADRIGGCMMTATQVFGKKAGECAAQRAKALARYGFPDIRRCSDIEWADRMRETAHINHITNISLLSRQVLGEYAMILRRGDGLKTCKKKLKDCQSELEAMKSKATIPAAQCLELRNMILTSRLVLDSALMRKQSLGPHFREDYPKPSITTRSTTQRPLFSISSPA
ncbi:MAG: FAD-binding protein [Deltaproteobacteria bacterium]|nr:FAD-binding protein [Deltaproteobacteria bacterium]